MVRNDEAYMRKNDNELPDSFSLSFFLHWRSWFPDCQYNIRMNLPWGIRDCLAGNRKVPEGRGGNPEGVYLLIPASDGEKQG